jgi:hypothetical protein
MRHTRTSVLNFKELSEQLTALGWLKISPENLLAEISQTLARIDTEPKFFTFNSLSNMGQETYLKLTNSDFTQRLDLNSKGDFDYDQAYKREL